MPEITLKDNSFLKPGDFVNVGVDLPGKKFAEDLATVVANVDGEILLNLNGSGFPAHVPATRGARVIITQGEERAILHCTASLKEATDSSQLKVELPHKVTVYERREYTREDVMLPVRYALPATQDMGRVIAEWEAFKRCSGNCGREMTFIDCGATRANISGSGLRFKIRDCLAYGTLLHISIDLPGHNPDHIHAIGAIIRTKELLHQMDHMEYYSTSMSFRMIENSDRLKLIRHIIAAQHKTINSPEPGYL